MTDKPSPAQVEAELNSREFLALPRESRAARTAELRTLCGVDRPAAARPPDPLPTCSPGELQSFLNAMPVAEQSQWLAANRHIFVGGADPFGRRRR